MNRFEPSWGFGLSLWRLLAWQSWLHKEFNRWCHQRLNSKDFWAFTCTEQGWSSDIIAGSQRGKKDSDGWGTRQKGWPGGRIEKDWRENESLCQASSSSEERSMNLNTWKKQIRWRVKENARQICCGILFLVQADAVSWSLKGSGRIDLSDVEINTREQSGRAHQLQTKSFFLSA